LARGKLQLARNKWHEAIGNKCRIILKIYLILVLLSMKPDTQRFTVLLEINNQKYEEYASYFSENNLAQSLEKQVLQFDQYPGSGRGNCHFCGDTGIHPQRTQL
jgi:hypothetical protein